MLLKEEVKEVDMRVYTNENEQRTNQWERWSEKIRGEIIQMEVYKVLTTMLLALLDLDMSQDKLDIHFVKTIVM